MSITSKNNGGLTVAEMAAAVGLSRDRFNDLVRRGIFPPPVYLLESRRPIYIAEIQRICHAVRSNRVGFNGEPITFNRTRRAKATIPNRPLKAVVRDPADLFAASLIPKLHRLGLTDIDDARVRHGLDACYPEGIAGIEPTEIIPLVVRYLSSPADKEHGNHNTHQSP